MPSWAPQYVCLRFLRALWSFHRSFWLVAWRARHFSNSWMKCFGWGSGCLLVGWFASLIFEQSCFCLQILVASCAASSLCAIGAVLRRCHGMFAKVFATAGTCGPLLETRKSCSVVVPRSWWTERSNSTWSLYLRHSRPKQLAQLEERSFTCYVPLLSLRMAFLSDFIIGAFAQWMMKSMAMCKFLQ